MIKKIEVFEVNGELYKTEEEAMEVINRSEELVAKKIVQILNEVEQITQINEKIKESGYLKLTVEVNDRYLIPEFYRNKPQNTLFETLLGELGLKYYSHDGDERGVPYLKIVPQKIKNIPTEKQILQKIKEFTCKEKTCRD